MDWRISTTVARCTSYQHVVLASYTWQSLHKYASKNLRSEYYHRMGVVTVVTHQKVPVLTLTAASPPYGAFSKAPRRAPSLSPPRSSCLICDERLWTSDAETEATAGASELVEKLAGDSGSRRSMLMVLQLTLAMQAALQRCVTKYLSACVFIFVFVRDLVSRGKVLGAFSDSLSKQPFRSCDRSEPNCPSHAFTKRREPKWRWTVTRLCSQAYLLCMIFRFKRAKPLMQRNGEDGMIPRKLSLARLSVMNTRLTKLLALEWLPWVSYGFSIGPTEAEVLLIGIESI